MVELNEPAQEDGRNQQGRARNNESARKIIPGDPRHCPSKPRKQWIEPGFERARRAITKFGDENAALEQTRVRFGIPANLTSQLQQTVPWRDAFVGFSDRLFGFGSSQSTWKIK